MVRNSALATRLRRRCLRCVAAGLLSVILFAPFGVEALVAQEPTGRIAGRVLDEETGQPLPMTQVFLAATEFGAMTDVDGRYSLTEVPAGVYDLRVQLIGYAQKTVTGVEVMPGKTTVVDISVPLQAVAVEELSVTVADERGTTEALLSERKRAPVVTDAIGRDQMSKSPDSDAAAAMQRVPGVSVVDAKFVYVRGLGERYGNTTLDGAVVPSPIPDRKAIPLDLLPASFLESVSTSKSYLPDQPGDYAGGLVQLKTRKVPGVSFFKLGAGAGYNTTTTLESGLGYAGGSFDWLGIDDGTRDLPSLVPLDQPVNLGTFSAEELEAIGESFTDATPWGPRPEEHPLNGSFDAAFAAEIGVGRGLGLVGSVNYGSQWNRPARLIERVFNAAGLEDPDVDYAGTRSVHEVNFGALLNADLPLSNTSRITLQTMFNRLTEDEARVLEGFNLDFNTNQRNTRLRYIENNLFQGQLSGKHYLNSVLGGSTLEWRGAYSRTGRYEPNTREVLYRQASNGDYLFDTFIQSGSVFHQDLDEDGFNGGLDYSIPIRVHGVPGQLKLGAAGTYRDREVYTRRFRFLPQGALGDSVRRQDPDPLFGIENIAPDSFQLQEATFRPDNYDADQTILGAYVMADLEILPRLRLAGGVRVEKATQTVASRDLFTPGLEPLTEADLDDTDVIPSLNLTYALSEEMNLRAAGSRTLARPEFRELAPFSFADFAGGYLVVGNPLLQRTRVTNADLRWEWFPNSGAVISVSGFYKFFDDPIEEIVFPSTEFIKSWVNVDNAENYGAEFEVRSDLGFLAEGLETLALNANLTLVQSSVTTGGETPIWLQGAGPTTIVLSERERALQGQSPYMVNLGLSYLIPGPRTFLTVLYNRFGRRIDAVGTEFLEEVYEESRNIFDVVLEQPIGAKWEVKLTAKNLFGSKYEFTQADDLLRGWVPGRSFSAKISWWPVGVNE